MEISLNTKVKIGVEETKINVLKENLFFKLVDVEEENIIIRSNDDDIIIISIDELCVLNDKVLEAQPFKRRSHKYV